MQPPLLLSAVLLVPLALPGVLRAQQALRREDRDIAIRAPGAEVRNFTGPVVAQERTPASASQGAARQGLGGAENHHQPGWYCPPGWPVNPSPFLGWDLHGDGGFQPFDGLSGPPDSFWFYRPSPSFWFYRPYNPGHPHP
jgi:hypothetical protein